MKENEKNSKNSCNNSIYYISDLHLFFKLKEKFGSEYLKKENVDFYLNNVVEQMYISLEKDSINNYIVIAGDVSSLFEITKNFFIKVRKKIKKSKIIYVLGNHEYWCFKDSTIKQINQYFKKELEANNIICLYNELCIIKRNSIKIFSEKEILSMNDKEILKLTNNSKQIFFGSTGFAGLNKTFNCDSGMYRNLLTDRKIEKKESRITSKCYFKLYTVLKLEKVNIVTHMNIEDFTKVSYNKNWNYFSGHTHKNIIINSLKINKYADNQIGYYSNNYSLKRIIKKD